MVIVTAEKFPYFIGFSTVFFALSVLMIWPIRYFLIPMVIVGIILGISQWNAVTDIKVVVTGVFLMMNVGMMTGVASWLTYQNYLKNLSLMEKLQLIHRYPTNTGKAPVFVGYRWINWVA